jgi:hypothetical protein
LHSNRNSYYVLIFIMVSITLVAPISIHRAQAQSETPSPPPSSTTPTPGIQLTGEGYWSPPINLSHSGSATQPRIVAAHNGQLQVFWIDRFDGLITSLFNGEAWSLPAQSKRKAVQVFLPSEKITVMPALYTDTKDRMHAFWYGEKDKDTGESPLLYDQMPIGQNLWSSPLQVSPSAPAFGASPTVDGDMQLAFVRTLQSQSFFPRVETVPAGVYTIRSTGGGESWGESSPVDTSIYYRVLNPENALIRVAVTGSAVFIAWLEPRLQQVLYAVSTDYGNSWSKPGLFGPAGVDIQSPQLAVLPSGEVIKIWQDGSQSGCVLYQQKLRVDVNKNLGAQTPVPSYLPSPTPEITLSEWSEPSQILSGLDTCPSGVRFFTESDTLYWVWGEGSQLINLSAWDPTQQDWSLPQSFSFNFEDPETRRPVQLKDLHATLMDGQLAVAGSDPASGEVWATISGSTALELVFSEPSPWIKPKAISSLDRTSSQPAVTIDSIGQTHVVWSQGQGIPGTALYYSRFDNQEFTQSVAIIKAASGEIVRQPNLVVDAKDYLHLAWSGGPDGEIFYSRARTDQAASASGWLPAIQVSGTGTGSWPQIAIAYSGRMYILYTIQVNEGRGVYLVYSDDGGENWSNPALVFDAGAAGWEMVDHSTLTIAPDGSLHAAWVHMNIASARSTQGISYSRTRAAFQPSIETSTPNPSATPISLKPDPQWIIPIDISEAGSDWPKLATLGNQLHIIYYSEGVPTHRWLDLSQQTSEGVGWGTPLKLPGWSETFQKRPAVVVDTAPYTLASDFQNLRVIAPDVGGTSIRMSEWVFSSSSSSGRWLQPESYSPAGVWVNLPSIAAMSPMKGSSLAVAWLVLPDNTGLETPLPSLPLLMLTLREIQSAEAILPVAATPIVNITESPVGTQTPTPTVTPVISNSPEGQKSPVSPLVLGSGLAAIIVIAIFIGILIQGKGH